MTPPLNHDWPVLSIRQPWAWLIVYGGKDVENRSWPTQLRGRIYIHTGMTMREEDYRDGFELYMEIATPESPRLPAYADLPRGGIVGSAEITDCVTQSTSPWFAGPYGFLLANAREEPFVRLAGRLGFFQIGRWL